MTIDEAPFTLLDTETGGVDKSDDLLEIGAHRIPGEASFRTLVHPTRPIPPAASAVHHLVDSDFADAPDREAAVGALLTWLDPNAVFVAHNATFDRGFLPELDGRPWLCSFRLAHHLLPDAPAFGNAALWYYLGGHKITDTLHGAIADVTVTRFVFDALLTRYREWAREKCAGDAERLAKSEQVETLIAFAERPYVMKTMPFGKHRGVLMDELPKSYCRWMLDNATDLDADVRFNFDRQLKRRAA